MEAIAAHADDSAGGVRAAYHVKQVADFSYHLDFGGNHLASLIP